MSYGVCKVCGCTDTNACKIEMLTIINLSKSIADMAENTTINNLEDF